MTISDEAARIVREHSYDVAGAPRYTEAAVREAIESYVADGLTEAEAVSFVEHVAQLGLDLPKAVESDARTQT